MEPHAIDTPAVRRDPAARAVVRRWRQLTGGSATRDHDRRTLAACSGGADSTALVLALAGVGRVLTIAHIVHDLREPADTHAERDRVAQLAAGLGLDFVECSVAVRAVPGNAEANARRARYRELERLAWETGCPFVATGHHAADQLETMLMAIVRGTGVGGLAGMPGARPLGARGVRLVRPMLGVGRDDAERLCTTAGVGWATDPTNADISRLRAALRHGPARELASLRPTAPERAAELAEHLREVHDLLRTLVATVIDGAQASEGVFAWARPGLSSQHPAVLSAALREAHSRLHGARHGDRLPARTVREAVNAVRANDGVPRRFDWKDTEVLVSPDRVTVRRVDQ